MLGACGRVVQKGIGEAHISLLACATWEEPNGSVYCRDLQHYVNLHTFTQGYDHMNEGMSTQCMGHKDVQAYGSAFMGLLHNGKIDPIKEYFVQPWTPKGNTLENEIIKQ